MSEPILNELTISIPSLDGVKIHILSASEKSCIWNNAESDEDSVSSPYQLEEGGFYEYELPKGYYLQAEPGFITHSKTRERDGSTGRITPGFFTGTKLLKVVSKVDDQFARQVAIEIRSTKLNYLSEYRFMLEQITEKCVDLLLMMNAPTQHYFRTDYGIDSKTAYQKFAFISSLMGSSGFKEAVHRITKMPVSRWVSEESSVSIRRLPRLSRTGLRQIVSAGNRIRLPESHPLSEKLSSVPSTLALTKKAETLDTPENQFVKFVLESFAGFCTLVAENSKSGTRSHSEASGLESEMRLMLEHSLFREQSNPSLIPLNSPVLQRKAGYREVLRAWLQFQLSAVLTWEGGDDVYAADKRDVATLYEYWLFFKLFGLFSSKFNFDDKALGELIKETGDKLGVQLKAGKESSFTGVYEVGGVSLQVKFSFNRTFSNKGSSYPKPGSWTLNMRPDYTLSFWPSGLSDNEAEVQELITHIHFDAKYKLDSFKDLVDIQGDIDQNLDEEKEDARSGKYKRADLLKMHAYKDAIRRTAGAYVLYPGTESQEMIGFHELLPGLGAFPVRPERDADMTELEHFIDRIAAHLASKVSQSKKSAFYTYATHASSPLKDAGDAGYAQKTAPLDPDHNVLVGYVKNAAHWKWINGRRMYNIRANADTVPTSTLFNAKYILLWDGSGTVEVFEVSPQHPVILTKNDMSQSGYPSPSHDYFVFSLVPAPSSVSSRINQDFSLINALKPASYTEFMPYPTKLGNVLKPE